MDWTSLVDTATKAIYSTSPVPAGAKTSGGEDSAGGLSPREEEVRALLERVAGLEEELAGERRDRGELEAQVDEVNFFAMCLKILEINLLAEPGFRSAYIHNYCDV